MKTAKIFIWKFIPITHSIIYHIKKPKIVFLCGANIIKLLRVFIDEVVFSFLSDRVLFRFLIYRILFRVLSDRVFLESSVIGSTSGSAVIDSSLTSSVPFFRHVTICLIKSCYHLFIRNRCFVLHCTLKKKFALKRST